MPVKTSGAEFKRFYNDATFWPEGAWHDDDVILVDGVEQEDIDVEKIPETAKVTIEAGVVFMSDSDDRGVGLDTHFRRWHKAQTTRQIVVEVDVAHLDALIAAIKAAGGRVQ